MNKKYKAYLHRCFKITILIKGIDGVFEVIASAILFISGANSIIEKIPSFVQKELIKDPDDMISNYLLHIFDSALPDTQLFIAIYLAIHGLIKIGLVFALNSKSYRAHEIAKIILIIFIGYQFYRFEHTHSMLLFILTCIDVIIVSLIHSEEKRLRRNKENSPAKDQCFNAPRDNESPL